MATTQTDQSEKQTKPLRRKRILVCGKGGSGKSTLVSLMAAALGRKGYEVMVLDGDASNPEGLVRLLFGLGVQGEPKPLVEFFGGIDTVTCPVDDPSPLKRIGESVSVPEQRIDVFKEVGPEYYLKKGSMTLLQAGKIETYGQGCDGPLEKVVRDFLIEGDFVNLIDEKAGVEHFGRRIPDRMDIVLGVLDCTLESVSIARRINEFSKEIGMTDVWFILNKLESEEIESLMVDRLADLRGKVIGRIGYDPELVKAGLAGRALDTHKAVKDAEAIVRRLEQAC